MSGFSRKYSNFFFLMWASVESFMCFSSSELFIKNHSDCWSYNDVDLLFPHLICNLFSFDSKSYNVYHFFYFTIVPGGTISDIRNYREIDRKFFGIICEKFSIIKFLWKIIVLYYCRRILYLIRTWNVFIWVK